MSLSKGLFLWTLKVSLGYRIRRIWKGIFNKYSWIMESGDPCCPVGPCLSHGWAPPVSGSVLWDENRSFREPISVRHSGSPLLFQHSGGRNRRIASLRPAQEKVGRHCFKNKIKRRGGLAAKLKLPSICQALGPIPNATKQGAIFNFLSFFVCF
jgi:hypothetical protein